MKIPLETILIENSEYSNCSGLRKRLIKEKVLENKCAECGIEGIWNDNIINLNLHHINGKHDDHRLENLIILCPNCHSQTDNFCSKNTVEYKLNQVKKEIHAHIDVEINKTPLIESKKCSICNCNISNNITACKSCKDKLQGV